MMINKIGPNTQAPIQPQQTCCCHDSRCHCNNQQIESDKFDKAAIDKPTLKKILPASVISGLAGAGGVLAVSALANIAVKSKPLVSALAVITGFGVASMTMNSLVKGKEKPNA